MSGPRDNSVDPVVESIGPSSVRLDLPSAESASELDRVIATRRLNTRKVGWGCQIAVDVDNSGNVVLGHLSPDGTRSKEPNLIHVDIAAAPAKDWEPPYVSVLISLPRETSVSEHYVTNLDNTSTQHIVEMRLRASGNDDQGFEVTACKSTRGDNCYHVTISNIKHALAANSPNGDASGNQQSLLSFKATSAWRVLLPKRAMELLVLGLRNIRLFGMYYPPARYKLGAKHWNFDLAGCVTLCAAQNMPVLLTASRNEAVDACLRKVEILVKTTGLDCTVVRVFGAAEDKAACKRVFQHRSEPRNAEFRVRSKWRHTCLVAFWVAYHLGMESSPWTDRRLDATTAPECFHDAQHVARQLDEAPDDLPESQKS